jgi:hypothetical protein
LLGQALPDPVGQAQNAFLQAGAVSVQKFSTAAPEQIEGVRKGVAPLSAYNEQSSKFVGEFADGLDSIATAGGKTIAPGDLSLRQIATAVRSAQEDPPAPC